jgi:hypothetical protein
MPSTAERMMALLSGFVGAHGTYEEEEFSEDKRKREIKRTARTLKQPVTVDLWERHLAGIYHLGVITICEDNNCHWGVVDIDDYTIQHTDLVSQLRDMAVPAIVCRTKSGGAHVYLFFSEPIPARDVMRKLRELSAALGHGGCEVFPKQTHVATEQHGLGNWLNMPYYAGDRGITYAVGPEGLGLSLEQFIRQAESSRIDRRQLMSMRFRRRVEGWEEAPPCLEHLAGTGVEKGAQNNALFSFGVLAKKMKPEGWERLIFEWNEQFIRPPHPAARIKELIDSLSKKSYNYKCHDAPCVSHCNMALCRTRKYGIGPGGGADIIESVSILDTEPPLFFVLLKTGGTVECGGADLLSPRTFQQLVLEQLQLVVPQYTQELWLPQVQQAVEGATKIESPPEVGLTGRLNERLEKFCTDRHSAEKKEEILLGKPWRDDEKTMMVWFRLSDFQDYLDRSKFSGLRPSQITERIKKRGGGHGFFNLSGKGVNVWGVPTASLVWTNGEIKTPDIPEAPL